MPISNSTSRDFDAVIFDMDGVITRTAEVHSAAWKRMFDSFLEHQSEKNSEPYREFDHSDYLNFVDGRPRYQGVESFLDSRSITLPKGSVNDAPGFTSIYGLGNLKNVHFNNIVDTDGVGLYDSSLALIDELRKEGIRIGLATSSRNASTILGKTNTHGLFETVVDGLVSEKLGLRGKPEPDIFAAACANLGIKCSRAIVVEDAVTGVQAGMKGGFALTVGVAREDNEQMLRENGADLVVTDLLETNFEQLNKCVLERRVHT